MGHGFPREAGLVKRWAFGTIRCGVALGAAVVLSAASPSRPLVAGLDHLPLAVNDLRQAEADFQRLGFVIKPGRHHDDGIRNAHVKFADHTEIELITATAPVDRLTREYVTFLRDGDGDGPESFGLYSPDLDAVTSRLTAMRLAPLDDGEIVTFSQAAFAHQLFFADREPSRTDRPAMFAHPNGAYHLQEIDIVASHAERRLLLALGATRRVTRGCAPFATSETFAFRDGTVVLTGARAGRPPARSIVGAVVLVRDLRTVRALLEKHGIATTSGPACTPASIWLRPALAHGLWLGFRQEVDALAG